MGSMKVLALLYFLFSVSVGDYTGCTEFESLLYVRNKTEMNSSLCQYDKGIWSFTGEMINGKPSFILLPERCSTPYGQLTPEFLMFAKLYKVYSNQIFSSITEKNGWCVAKNLFFRTCDFANDYQQEIPSQLYWYFKKDSDYISFRCIVNVTQQNDTINALNSSLTKYYIVPSCFLVIILLFLLFIILQLCSTHADPTQI